MHYFGHRFYDPTLGRFITADPLGFADGPNRYLYAQANPLTQTDPDGLLARQIGLKAADWADANFSLVNDDWRYMPTMNELEWSDWGDYVPATVQNLLIAPIWNLAAGTLNPMIDVNIYGADSEYAVYLFISLHPEVAMQLEYTVQTVGPLLESSLGRMSQWISGNKSQSVAAPKTRVGYHATYPEAAQGIRQTGFRPGTKPGRLGAGGTYVNNTAEGAIFEFTHHNPGVTPEVLKVRYNPGVEAVTDIAPVNYVERLPLNVDSISAPSVRLPGTQNTITYNPLEVLP